MKSLPRPRSVFCAVLCLSLIGSWSALSRTSARADDAKEPPAVALKGLDPILLIEGKETKGKPDLSATRDGFRYLFASEANKAKFDKDPERYAIQFHGGCAMMPESARAEPDLFTVYKERIYAFGTEGCQDAFLKEPERGRPHLRQDGIARLRRPGRGLQ
jgi:YHS domain-containing protein